MSIKKKYEKQKNSCKVTFTLPKEVSSWAKKAYVVGEFNNWNTTATPMKKRNGSHNVTLELKPKKDYQFRYVIDGTQWENDWEADNYIDSPYSCQNSVVSI